MIATEQTEAPSADSLSRRVEEASINAWPAMQQVLLDGWLLRFARGFTKRANSVVPLHPGEQDVAEKIRFCENVYARERLKTIFRLTSIGAHDELDGLLDARGYRHRDLTEVQTMVLTGKQAGKQPVAQAAAGSAELQLLPMERWLDVYSALTAESGGGSSAALQERAQALHGAILRGIPLPCAYGAVGGHPPSACGLAVLQQDLVGLFDVVTHPGNRRLGHGTQLVQGLLNWAYERGARRAYLQMVADNHPARGLYAQLGFEPLYRYWYRISE